MSGRRRENGLVILLVAVVLLFVVGAMAALAIDVVSLYSARSEAQLAADGAALAGARALANSGMTSKTTDTTLAANAENMARLVATQVAIHNEVGGRKLVAAEVTVTFNNADPTYPTNPRVTVQTRRADLPAFFSRIWGNNALAVAASATAEVYNPSGVDGLGQTVIPVAPTCVKPWLLPNIDPTQTNPAGPAIFDRTTGAIVNSGLVGQGWPVANPGLSAVCGDCSGGLPTPTSGRYYPGRIDSTDFPVPTQALPACSAAFNPYQQAIAGCVTRPIACGENATINVDASPYVPNTTDRDVDTVQAASCLIHYSAAAGETDSVDPANVPSPPFHFLAGTRNPVAGARGNDVLVSDSLVTMPVFDSTSGVAPTNPVTVIGFLQVFLNPSGNAMAGNQIPVTIINMVGCGTDASGTAIQGNGPSAVPVRLVSP
jgi:hypothetical protein